ncbi:uncharacterized protein N0V89_001996 [Didymosphaeria variabile]|uniref:Uncharacterized protein n=1 Tax=Didymosphaeria variabile TaxID=1932322 RepID=A0A9W8XRA8_9PLEO|nr:uncharacterized protein N0V89_001996 [Didymosphaeria variabile]KAJ4357421.1 hypothetical protein N0V89_001996 [Didymosphaeria variabile]
MDDPSRAGSHLARDPCLYPMDPMEMSCFDIRAAHVPVISAPRRSQDTRTAKRKGTSSPPRISLEGYTNGNGYWITSSLVTKRSRLQQINQESRLEQQMHQSTCLNLNADAQNAEADLWILPDFDEWEIDNDPPQQAHHQTKKKQGAWAPLVKRAASSNRERLRRRLEGDGWDFVGGKYGEDDAALKEAAETSEASQESVDEEFDVVVLPMVRAAC